MKDGHHTTADLLKLAAEIQDKIAKEYPSGYKSLALPACTLEHIPMVKNPEEAVSRIYGFPVHTSKFIPEGFGVGTTECHCNVLERMRPDHLSRHVVILDFRSEEEKRASELKG